MDLKRVRTFVTVVEQGSVSKAATRLHITQPALSRQVRDLQQELGFRLFDRVGRGLVLTSEGEQLLGDCRRLLSDAASLTERAQLLQRGDAGVLKIAASPAHMEAVLSTFLHRYAQRYPNVLVRLIEAVGADTLALLERAEVHLGILLLRNVQADDHHLGINPAPPVELLACCHPSFQIRGVSTIDVARLSSYPLLLLNYGFAVRKTFDAVCRLDGLKPNILIESGVPSNLLALAEAGHGIAVIPSVVPTHRYALRIMRITHRHKPLREPLGVVWDKRRMLPRYVQEFAELIAAHMRAHLPIAHLSGPLLGGVAKKLGRVRVRNRVHAGAETLGRR